jgi:hypothetical protein
VALLMQESTLLDVTMDFGALENMERGSKGSLKSSECTHGSVKDATVTIHI